MQADEIACCSLGLETTTVAGRDGDQLKFMNYSSVLNALGHVNKTVALLKIDIEGYEFDVLSGECFVADKVGGGLLV